jgi:hypothetical protein
LKLLQKEVYVPYTEGSWKGILANDIIHLQGVSNEISFPAVVALVTESSGFFINGSGWQGILGLAYRSIARVSTRYDFKLAAIIFNWYFKFIVQLINLELKKQNCR